MSQFIPRESWTCTHGECCADGRCERWTWRVSVGTVVAFLIVGVVALAQAVLR